MTIWHILCLSLALNICLIAINLVLVRWYRDRLADLYAWYSEKLIAVLQRNNHNTGVELEL